MHATYSPHSVGTRMVYLDNMAIIDNASEHLFAEKPGKCTTVVAIGAPLYHDCAGNARFLNIH